MTAPTTTPHDASGAGAAARRGALRRRLLRAAWMVRFEGALDHPPAGPQAHGGAPARLVVRRATAADDHVLAQLALGREPMAARRARGDVALIAELDGRAVGCTFVARAPVRLDGYLLVHAPRPDEAYHYGLHVLRDARRLGIAEALSRAVAGEARAAGARLLTCWVDEANRPGVALQQALGMRARCRMLLLVVASRVSVSLGRRELRCAEGR